MRLNGLTRALLLLATLAAGAAAESARTAPCWFPLGSWTYQENDIDEEARAILSFEREPHWFQSFERGGLPRPSSIDEVPLVCEGAQLTLAVIPSAEDPDSLRFELCLSAGHRSLEREVEHRHSNVLPFLFAFAGDGATVTSSAAEGGYSGGMNRMVELVPAHGERRWSVLVSAKSLAAILPSPLPAEVQIVAAFSERQHEILFGEELFPGWRDVETSIGEPRRQITRPDLLVRSNAVRLQPKAGWSPVIPGFTYLRAETFAAGGQAHRIAVYSCNTMSSAIGLDAPATAIDCEFVLVPGGVFQMGSNNAQRCSPEHEVSVPAFLIARTEVSQRVWAGLATSASVERDPSYFRGSRLPVEQVSWDESKRWCAAAQLELPSEAEWEYACRAGTTSAYCFGDALEHEQAQFGHSSGFASPTGADGQTTVAAGSLPPNAFGLHEVHGNIWEWCEDTWQDSFDGAPADGSARVDATQPWRAIRGGSWLDEDCASLWRMGCGTRYRRDNIGFRPAMSLTTPLPMIGGTGGEVFLDSLPGALLAGVVITLADFEGRRVIGSMQAIFVDQEGKEHRAPSRGTARDDEIEVLAPQGWVVAGMVAAASDRLNGFALLFAPRAPSGQSSMSAWRGSGGGTVKLMGGPTTRIAALCGRHGSEIDAAGVLAEAEARTRR